jgi:hypothetical protein
MTNVMHMFVIYLSIYFCLTCFGLYLSPSSETGAQLRQWFKPAGYGALCGHTISFQNAWCLRHLKFVQNFVGLRYCIYTSLSWNKATHVYADWQSSRNALSPMFSNWRRILHTVSIKRCCLIYSSDYQPGVRAPPQVRTRTFRGKRNKKNNGGKRPLLGYLFTVKNINLK